MSARQLHIALVLTYRTLSRPIHAFRLYWMTKTKSMPMAITKLAALEIIDRITQHLDKGATPINIYLDLSKAFDTLDHNILLHKLKHYGIQDNALDLFRSYLTERQQYVDFNGTKSNR